jgi:hypothetical protein
MNRIDTQSILLNPAWLQPRLHICSLGHRKDLSPCRMWHRVYRLNGEALSLPSPSPSYCVLHRSTCQQRQPCHRQQGPPRIRFPQQQAVGKAWQGFTASEPELHRPLSPMGRPRHLCQPVLYLPFVHCHSELPFALHHSGFRLCFFPLASRHVPAELSRISLCMGRPALDTAWQGLGLSLDPMKPPLLLQRGNGCTTEHEVEA